MPEERLHQSREGHRCKDAALDQAPRFPAFRDVQRLSTQSMCRSHATCIPTTNEQTLNEYDDLHAFEASPTMTQFDMDPRCLLLTSHTMQFHAAECNTDSYLPMQESDVTEQLHVPLGVLSTSIKSCLECFVACRYSPQDDLALPLPHLCDCSDCNRPIRQSNLR